MSEDNYDGYDYVYLCCGPGECDICDGNDEDDD